MATIKFNIPDAWVNENNYVYGVVEGPGSQAQWKAVREMNESLGEWVYPGRIEYPDQCRQMWVEPEVILREQWNPDLISHEPVNGWVHLLYANAEELW
ncbi:hypothetical protein SEA_WATERT_6 [Microbacterium phage WaterT]|nr:hypothetical protein SEA_WATERT_6 [Microbacterium phage WaterT]